MPPHYDYSNAVPKKGSADVCEASEEGCRKALVMYTAENDQKQVLILTKLVEDHGDISTVAKKIHFPPGSPVTASAVLKGIVINGELGFQPDLELRRMGFEDLRTAAFYVEEDSRAKSKSLPATAVDEEE